MSGLQGKRVAITGGRKGEEISKLIENFGGVPFVRPTQGTVYLDESQVGPDIERLLAEGADWMILTTGVGSQAMLDVAERMGRKEELIALLGRVHIASRGYKTRNFLKGIGLSPEVQDEEGTIRDLLRRLGAYDLRGASVVLQLHGERPPSLIRWLEQAGARYHEILPYEHIPPEAAMIEQFIGELRDGAYDAVTFTSALQVQYLFSEARRLGAEEALLECFRTGTVAVAVGVVTAEALQEVTVERVVQPENQRMGAMVVELNHYFQSLA